ncbi:MAG TPA: CPBP family intramembrane glutamic endopeptidase [Candidatus Angelobacter sp.]
MAVLAMVILNILAAFMVRSAVASGARIERLRHPAEHQEKIAVSSDFMNMAKLLEETWAFSPGRADQLLDRYYTEEARLQARDSSESEAAINQKLRDSFRNHGTRNFVVKEPSNVFSFPLDKLPGAWTVPAMLGSIVLIWWGVMLVFQGEGLELDLQRRRHPMWEWLFSHPVPSGAVFFAEMLSPIAANPIYWGAPLFVGVLYGFVYDPGLAFLATFLIGVPLTIAAASMGKALEIGIILRFSPRTRGAMIGLMSWMGYSSMMLFFVGFYVVSTVVAAIGKFLIHFTVLPWPWLRLFLGGQSDGSFSFLSGVLTCWTFAGVTLAGAVWFSVWGAQQGLAGNLGRAHSGPSASRKTGTRFGKEPLYRKEFLWFIRDRSAIVQTILIPLTIAGYQVFNMRSILTHAQGAWNYLCGAAILFGTYFLWVLGPKSLSSEGTALWIALTWPRGLENLLKAKAWLWSLISSAMVLLVLCYAAYLFPINIWQIALVGIGWFFFSQSMAEKTVTLVTVPSSSGEPQKIPRGRQWAAQLGMLTFSIGVLTQQWHIAVMGIVYSYITAAAMWENFRARLPYLYDTWSERLPPPPTLMHAMIAISLLVEGGAVFTTLLMIFTGREYIAMAQVIGYGICAALVCVGMSIFLSNRNVPPIEVWLWRPIATAPQQSPAWWRVDESRKSRFLPALLAGAVGGLLLGLFAHGYVAILSHFPTIAEMFRKSQEQMAQMPGLRVSFAVIAVALAPFAEEYLFRGLLFRALDREWGGWRALVGSAAFFAVYHPPLSWLPVALLGFTNAYLFKKTGWLAPAIILHMVYNAVVLI